MWSQRAGEQLVVMKSGSSQTKVLLRVGPAQWHSPKDITLFCEIIFLRMKERPPYAHVVERERDLETMLTKEKLCEEEKLGQIVFLDVYLLKGYSFIQIIFFSFCDHAS